MPSSRPEQIATVVNVVRQLQPRSILELGVGFGKWGHLFREYLDIVWAEQDPSRYQRDNWQVRIDGIEGHAPYISPAHEYLYNRLYIGDIRDRIHDVGEYDVVFLGDVIEHLEHEAGVALLRACRDHARQAVIITTPASPAPQDAVCGNALEMHRSHWTIHDFRRLGRARIQRSDSDTLIAVLLQPGVPAPRWSARRRRAAAPRWWRRLRQRARSLAQLLWPRPRPWATP